MSPFQNEYAFIIAILDQAHDDINAGVINPECFHKKNSILKVLNREKNILKTLIGVEVDGSVQHDVEAIGSEPIVKMFGKIVGKADTTKKAIISNSNEIEEIEAKTQAEDLYGKITGMEVMDILNSFTEETVYAVGNVAGITRNKGELYPQFVERLKKTIGKQIQPSLLSDKSPEQLAAEEMKAQAALLYPNFVAMENASILDSYDEYVIKFVAKMAGMVVSETIPKKVDVKYINLVKEAITKKQQLENLLTNGDDNVKVAN